MPEPTPAPPDRPARRPWRRIAALVLGVGLAALLVLLASVPALVRTTLMRDQILARINAQLAPGRLAVDRFEVSWTGPTRLDGFRLAAPDGTRVVDAPGATLDRSLAGLILAGNAATTLRIDRPAVRIYRHFDGVVDLVAALQTLIDHPDPARDLTVRLVGGTVAVGADGLAEPLVDARLDLDLHIPPAPRPLAWDLTLAHASGGTIATRGDLNRWTAPGNDPNRADLGARLVAKDWPISVRSPDLAVVGKLDGTTTLTRAAGRPGATGDLSVTDLALSGDRLRGDAPRLDRLALAWDLGPLGPEGGSGIAIRKLTADSPLGSIHVVGNESAPQAATDSGLVATVRAIGRVEGRVDLAGLAKQVPHVLGLAPGLVVDGGIARLDAEPSGPGGDAWKLDAGVTGLAAHDDRGGKWSWADPGTIAADLVAAADALTLRSLDVRTAYASASARGEITDRAEGRRFHLDGTITPDYPAITALLGDRVDAGTRVAGRPATFRVDGAWSGGSILESVAGRVGWQLDGADVVGMRVGPTSLAVRLDGGRVRIDPISTTLNDGAVRLEPEVVLDAGQGGPLVRLGPGSSIRDARINAEVSRRVLAFVAPVLEETTEASGRVSVSINSAAIPLGAGRSRETQVDGRVVFDDVAFAPGPLADALLNTIGRPGLGLKLDRPVTLTIADGRVVQDGLSIPVGNLTRIELAGSVDFDRNIDLTATLPVTPAMLGNNPLLSDIAAGTAVRLPIRGNLSRPLIDRDALTGNLKDLGESLLTRGATRGVLELLRRTGRPRNANPEAAPSPPPPTAEERKAVRQERRAERKALRNPPPAVPPQP